MDPSDDLARRLFEAARGEPLPTGAEHRVVEAIRRSRDAEHDAAPRRAIAFAVLAAALVFGVAFLVRRKEPSVAITGEPSTHAVVVAKAAASSVAEREIPSPSTPVEGSPGARPPRVSPPATLADEIAALKTAESALAASNPRAALEALDRYDHVLKGKQMRAEATLLRLEALTRAGNRRLAAALAARFVAQNPENPLVDRARSFLGGGAAADGGTP
jgi:hypothetical protein